MSYWSDKTVWITGASSGIGAELARFAAQRGSHVGLLARDAARLASVAASIRKVAPHEAHLAWSPCDVRRPEDVAHAADTLRDRIGPCDLLVANAGIFRQTDPLAFDAATAWYLFETNVFGVLTLFESVLPGMLERGGGHLVAISSLAGRIGLPQAAAYCASKASLIRLMESLRLDLKPHGIDVTTILPGTVDTPMITDAERPHAVPLRRAVARIARAIAQRRAVAAFPRRTSWLIRLARALPQPLFDAVMRHTPPMEEVAPETRRPPETT